MISDDSVDGSNPDTNEDGTPDESGTTDNTIGGEATLGLAKRIVSLNNNSDGTATVTYEINVENFSDLDIDSIQVSDELANTFAPCSMFEILAITSDDFTVNGNYNGVTDTLLLIGDDVLQANDKGAILFTVNIGGCMGDNGPYFNQAYGTGVSPGGEDVFDVSQEGSDPDPDGDGDPSNNSDGTETMFEFTSFIGLSKNLLSTVQNTDGSVDIEFEFTIENFGDQILSNIQLTDDLASTFDPCMTIEVLSLSSSYFDVNSLNYDGATDINLLLGTNILNPGDIESVNLFIKVSDCGTAEGPFFNSAEVTSLNEEGDIITDISQDGADADPDGDGDPTNDNVPTPIDFSFNPGIGVSKRLSYGPILSTEGCYDIGFEIKVQNYGDVDLYDIQVIEDLTAVFSATDIFSVVSIESEEFDVNPAFDGVTDMNLLLGLDTLISETGGDEGTINLLLNVCPDGMTDEYLNSVFTTAIAPGGSMVQDTSIDGSSPDPDGDGDPTNNSGDTPFQLECAQPYFTNCPELPINVDAPEGWCTAFVNFSAPQAEAECGLDTIIQVDQTGLNSGDLFPVGLTTLKWLAFDIQGNVSDTCILKIYVNDFHTPPVILCPEDIILTNDPFTCGATLPDVSLETVIDNCSDNVAITYEITDENGNVVSTGVNDATGAFVSGGQNTVTYQVHDQPILLITEVNHVGLDMIEIANLGPASIDINCLEIRRLGIGADSIIVPGSLILDAGMTTTFGFSQNLAETDPAGYTISTNGIILDEVSINGFPLAGFDGSTVGRTIVRNSIIDHDNADDWDVAYCSTSIGTLDLEAFPSNGTLTSLQGAEGSVSECSFTVTVLDEETPTCAEYEIVEFVASAATIPGFSCASSLTPSVVSSSGLVGTIQIKDLDIDHPNIGDLSVSLISPLGTRVVLFDGLCAGTVDVFTNLSDTSSTSINTALCTPLGSGFWHTPAQSFGQFTNEDPNGIWELEVLNNGAEVGIINGFTLELLELVPYNQPDVVLENDEGNCSAEFTWTNPVFQDNCEIGQVVVEYTSDDAAFVPDDAVVADGMLITQVFAVGTTNVQYTLIDAAGNSNTCGFTVTVLDTEVPVILDCPSDISITLGGGECCQILNFSDFPITDNCGIDSISYSTGNGVEYCIGSTTVEVTVFDESGNTATCSFEVVINENPVDEPFNFTCNGSINLSLDANCEAVITPDMILEGNNYGCFDEYCVTIIDENGIELPDSIVTIEHVNQQLQVIISDCEEGGASCWGYINVENKLEPEIGCPADITLACNADLTDLTITGEAELLSCEDEFTITYIDIAEDLGECADPRFVITRTWSVVNESGSESSCTQTIAMAPFEFDQILWPSDFVGDDRLSCSDVDADPTLTEPSNTGWPTIDGMEIFGDHYCDLFVGFWDEILYDATCPSGYSILRHWSIQNACIPLEADVNPIRHIQNIIVQDLVAPSLEVFNDVTISVDPWNCGASYPLPIPEMTDNCSSADGLQVQYSSIGGVISNDVLYINSPAVTGENEEVIVTVWASDECENYASTSFNVTVIDNVPPIIVAETSRTVSLSTDGIAKVFAEDFDDGSFDGCGPIEFFVRRMDEGADCSFVDEFGLYPGEENGHEVISNNVDDNTEFNDIVHFCCSDVGNTIMVQFKVCDDANADGIIGNEDDNCSLAMVEVEVQDKLAPQIICPADMSITCVDLAGLGDLQALSDEFLDEQFGSATAAASCNVTVTQSIVGSSACGAGTVIRNFTATNEEGLTSSCSQFITVLAGPTNVLTCDRISFADLNNTIYDWCDDDEDLPAINVDCTDDLTIPELNIDIDGLCTEVGLSITIDTFDFAGGACKKYLIHYEVIDQCIFDENYIDPTTGEIDPQNSGNGYFEMYIEIDAFDDEAPILNCEMVEVAAETCTGYNGSISISGTDNCTDPTFFGYQWRLDVDADDVIDTDWIQYSEVTASQVNLDEFPIGTHKIFWLVSDGCGNEATCEQLVIITENDKAPTPYCLDGLATAVMPSTGSVDLWAIDFDAGSFDNCDEDLVFTMIPEIDTDGLSEEEAYSASFNGTQQTNGDYGWTFTCDYIPNGISEILEVRIYVTDSDGNYDYCTASLRLDDNFDACQDDSGAITYTIEGDLKTETDELISNVDVTVDAEFIEFPQTENFDGNYEFELVENIDYTITPIKDDNHLNGISTADIILIQKHILGIQPLNSPYKMIAADANNDCKINGQDIIQIRKLLLGKYINDEFPENTSWRFVESDFEFFPGVMPCEFPEATEIPNLENNMLQDYIGTKIGDINESSSPGFTQSPDTRNDNPLILLVTDRLVNAGETIDIPVYATDFNDIRGLQLNYDNSLEFVGIESGKVDLTSENYSISENGLRISVEFIEGLSLQKDDILFTIKAISRNDGMLMDMITFTDQGMKTETYVGENLLPHKAETVFEGTKETTMEFALYQNEPNPFNSITNVSFEMPVTAEATFTIYDATGKVHYQVVDTYATGLHSLLINRENISASGVLFYKLESGDFIETKKMIVID
jgi:subtilisin-like proprotein convertase family protein